MLTKNQVAIVLAAIGTCCILAFQNCSNDIHRVYERTSETSQSSTSEDSTETDSSQSSANNGSNSGANTGSSGSMVTDPSLLFNFNADTQQACDAAVQSRLGKSVTCTFGGACGETCGRPSPTCVSTGLTRYGACLDSQGRTECKKAGTMIAFQNCGAITQPSSEVQVAAKSLTGCCSDTIYRVCAVAGNNIANTITCQ